MEKTKPIPEAIQARRRRTKIRQTVRAVAKASGVSESWLSKFEHGVHQRPKLESWQKVDRGLSKLEKAAARQAARA